jgi:hypothetical protein
MRNRAETTDASPVPREVRDLPSVHIQSIGLTFGCNFSGGVNGRNYSSNNQSTKTLFQTARQLFLNLLLLTRTKDLKLWKPWKQNSRRIMKQFLVFISFAASIDQSRLIYGEKAVFYYQNTPVRCDFSLCNTNIQSQYMWILADELDQRS